VQGHRLLQPLPARGAAVAAAVGQIRAGFIDKDEARNIRSGQGFHKFFPQGHDPLRVALSGVHAFFAAPAQALTCPPGGAGAQHRTPGCQQGLRHFGQGGIGLRAQAGEQALVTGGIQAGSRARVRRERGEFARGALTT
jgi:hypothetical protein